MKGNFQIFIVILFLAFAVFAVFIFAGIIPIGQSKNSANTPVGKVTIWGTFPRGQFSKVLDNLNSGNKDLVISYVEKSKDTYQQDLLESFASGTSPDVFVLSDDLIIKEQKQISPIPYASYPQKTFTDTFVDGGSIYLGKDGILGMPVILDPLVLYYNKDLLANQGIAQPPSYWDELFNLSDKLTQKTNDGTIRSSMIALGGYDNINNAKDILSLLLIQGGNPIMTKSNDKLGPTLNESFGLSKVPAESVLNFFSEFSNPTDGAYSWNRSLISSRDMFTGGKLAFYLGHASELFNIEAINPNLSFDVTSMLQTRGTNLKRTTAHMYALAISKSSQNPTGALGVVMLLSNPTNLPDLSAALSLPPARKDLLSIAPTDPYLSTFYGEAISARSWLDPDPKASNGVFRDLVNNVVSNKLKVGDAINKANGQLEVLSK